jgi:NAD(P)-dependent dehydrogenase (short-subunit alcohol dehydrogenase family)
MPGIKGKVVVIIGASSGIGETTALLLAERGAKVVLGARGPARANVSAKLQRAIDALLRKPQ